jgi:hypothetical protein
MDLHNLYFFYLVPQYVFIFEFHRSLDIGSFGDSCVVLSAPSKCERQIFLVCVEALIIGVR